MSSCQQRLNRNIANCTGIGRFSNANRFFTARRYASTVHAVVVSLSVRLSVRPAHDGIVPKCLNLGLRKQCRTIAHGL